MRIWRPAAVSAVLILAVLAARAEDDPWLRYQAQGDRIGALRIEVANVFDLSKPDEDYWLGRAADFIHIRTRERVIRELLLFKMGDRVDAATIHESERLLRALPWVQDATITPMAAGLGSVQAVVWVHDGWSLKGSLKFSSAGGQNIWRVRLHEVNLLGYGKDLLLSHEKDTERTTDEFAYGDPLLFGSRWTLSLGYQKLSDGMGRRLQVERPFYELSARWSAGVEAYDTRNVETLYTDDHKIYAFHALQQDVTLFGRWLYHFNQRTAWRVGAELRSMQASYGPLAVLRPGELPAPNLSPRRFRGILGYWAVSQDRYQTFEDIQSVARTEDINLGWDAEVHAGWMGKALGGAADAWYGQFTATKGTRLWSDSLLLFQAKGHGRRERGGGRDVLGMAEWSLYNQSLPRQTLAADLQLTAGYRLDPEDTLYIGGFDGLRGYPNHFRTGDRRWLFSAEDRIITPWTLWGLAQVGFVAYADAGAMRLPGGRFTRTYADVGGGLRFGNLKSTFGRVLSLTIAVPLVKEPGMDKFQIVVGNVIRF